jgi:DNA gyrase subunit B
MTDSHSDQQAQALPAKSPGSSAYGASQIKVLEGLEAVRKRPGMYIGGTSLHALHHLVYEVVDNSIDEAMAGFATSVTVSIEADGSVAVVDDGRGIPVDPVTNDDPALNGKSAIEIVMTKLHAGGKFGEEGSAYKVSGGLHGVGVSCVNALSDRCEVEVYRDGLIYKIVFSRGVVIEPLRTVGPIPSGATRTTGTTVTFHPDATIFPDTNFNFQTLANRLRELSFLNPGVTIRLHDERVGEDGKPKHAEYRADRGLPEYIEHMMTGKSAVCSLVHVTRERPEQNLICEVALQYHDGYNETVLSFANNINNVDGGTHAQGFKAALTRTINGYARKAGIIREKDPTPTGEDLREGLIAVISVKLPDPAFNNQPKERLLNPEIESFVGQAVQEGLEIWLEEHPGEAKKLCQKSVMAAQAREAARKARELTRRKSALESGSMPHKLRDCKTKDVERSELFIVEGDSAGGSATQGRDVDTQAILPLRGKLLNVEKARIDKMLAFEEIRTLISALRCGIGADFDISRLRYGRIVIMTDADVDGSHIRTLLLTFFFRQMPELIRRGRIYVAQPPLFQITRNRKSQYVLNERQLADKLTTIGLDGASLRVRTVEEWDEHSGVEEPPIEREIEGNDLRRAVNTLRRLMELVEIAERRGASFADLLSQRDNDPEGRGRLPTHRVNWRAENRPAWSESEALAIVEDNGLRLADAGHAATDAEVKPTTNGTPAGTTTAGSTPLTPEFDETAHRPIAVVRELHENRELESLITTLGELGLRIEDFALVREESITGQRLPARYAWVVPTRAKATDSKASDAKGNESKNGDGGDASDAGEDEGSTVSEREIQAANLPDILDKLNEIGRRGMEVKRFKGLGEMDAEQLWETTMDSSKRTLMRVSWDVGQEADYLFSTLMGDAVEPRRKYIEDHALEVKHLDV